MARSWFSVYLVSLCLLSFATQIYASGVPPEIPTDTPFSNRWPWITASTIRDGFFHNGFYLVGDEGTFMTSIDGETWKVCYSPVNGNYPYASFTNQYYIHSDDTGTVAFSETGDCRNTTFWSTTTQNFTTNLKDMQVAPELVPDNWTKGFVGVVDFKVYQSDTGLPGAWHLVEVVSSGTSYEAWAVSYADEKWVIKFADTSSGFIPYPIFFASSGDGVNWDVQSDIVYSASYDYSLSYCTGSNPKKWISMVGDGIITSVDAVDWELEFSLPNEYNLHTLACIGNRCVGANTYQIFETLDCGATWDDTISPADLSHIEQGFPVLSNGGVFLVAGEYGGVYVSKDDLVWKSVGAVEQDAEHLKGCTQVIPMKDKFIVSCPESSLISNEDGTNWKYLPYSLEVGDANNVQLSSYSYGQKNILAVGAQSEIFVSEDDGEEWESVASMKVDNKSAQLETLLHDTGSDSWIGFGKILWSISPTGTEEYVPVVVASPNGYGWKIYAPNYWITSAVYSPNHKMWIGAGPSGLFTADSKYYNWKPVSPVQGSCTKILTNYNYSKFIAQCTNSGSNIYKYSTNLKEWKDYYAPCGLSVRSPHSPESCSSLAYVQAWDRFVFFGSEPQGVSYTSDDGVEWAETIFPYAMSWTGITSIRDVILTLTKGVILSGTAGWLAYLTPVATPTYSGDLGPVPVPPVLPVNGELAVINESKFETSQSSEDEEDLNGGAIFGIVVASLFGLILIFVLAGVIALAAFVVIQLRKNPRERIYLLGEDENESL